ncbi:MAG: hypothetical protein LQ345_003644 [Seirophora villosa]|nr:MAG: hypothetical protein LQ345_003644 [Seirophora villosa]
MYCVVSVEFSNPDIHLRAFSSQERCITANVNGHPRRSKRNHGGSRKAGPSRLQLVDPKAGTAQPLFTSLHNPNAATVALSPSTPPRRARNPSRDPLLLLLFIIEARWDRRCVVPV